MNWLELCQLLQDILDYLGFDLFRLPLPANRVIPLCHKHTPVKKRSFVRHIGSACKFLQASRMHLQPHLIGGYDSLDSPNCHAANNCPNLGDLGWVIGEQHDISQVRLRSHLHKKDGARVLESKQTSIFLHRTRDDIFGDIDEFSCSTPDVSARSSVTTCDVTALEKISALEEELGKLRELLANIATVGKPPDVIPQVAPPPPPGVVGVPPPPPPPPPPPSFSTPAKSVTDLINERRQKNGRTVNGSVPATGRAPTMTDVLKGLSSVKLKTVSRSPGGTPLPKHRSKPAPTHMDPQALIAAALKRKFANLACSPDSKANSASAHSVTEDKENSFNSSCGVSPVKPEFGQHLLKARRPTGSILCAVNK